MWLVKSKVNISKSFNQYSLWIGSFMTVNYLIIRPSKGDFNPLSDHYVSIDNIRFAGHRGTGIGIRHDLYLSLLFFANDYSFSLFPTLF